MAGDQEHQPAAVAEPHTVDDQAKCGSGDMPAAVAEPHSLDQANCGGSGDTAAAAVAPKRKVRMHPADVRFVMSMKREELGGTEYLDALAHRYTPEEIEEMRRLHEELAALYLKDNDEIEARQAQIARELSEKGYVEVDAPPPADDDEVDLEEERKRWGDNLEDYDEWANKAEYDRWAQAFWDKNNKPSAPARINLDDPNHFMTTLSWVVRPYDADDEDAYQELDEAQVGDEDEDDESNEGRHKEEEEDTNGDEEEEDMNAKADSDGETPTFECNSPT